MVNEFKLNYFHAFYLIGCSFGPLFLFLTPLYNPYDRQLELLYVLFFFIVPWVSAYYGYKFLHFISAWKYLTQSQNIYRDDEAIKKAKAALEKFELTQHEGHITFATEEDGIFEKINSDVRLIKSLSHRWAKPYIFFRPKSDYETQVFLADGRATGWNQLIEKFSNVVDKATFFYDKFPSHLFNSQICEEALGAMKLIENDNILSVIALGEHIDITPFGILIDGELIELQSISSPIKKLSRNDGLSSRLVKQGWRYEKKNGTKDSRYKDNYAINIYEWWEVKLKGKNKSASIVISNLVIADIFCNLLSEYFHIDKRASSDLKTPTIKKSTNSNTGPSKNKSNNLPVKKTLKEWLPINETVFVHNSVDLVNKHYHCNALDYVFFSEVGQLSIGFNIFTDEDMPLIEGSKKRLLRLMRQKAVFALSGKKEISKNEMLEAISEMSLSEIALMLKNGLKALGEVDEYVEKNGAKHNKNIWLAQLDIMKDDIEPVVSKLSASNKNDDNNKNKPNELEKTFDELKDELHGLIGLQSVKEEIERLAALSSVQVKRAEMGLAVTNPSMHLIFAGNPGTGKTTVARIIGEMYRALGLLKSGHLVEVDRAGLVANYVGQTATKTAKVIESALDGVLFIDEAYSLSRSDSSIDYGQEAIEVILKSMEDNRDRLVIIVAGYPDLMQDFINSNPGLKSRFKKEIIFEDYSTMELTEIFKKLCLNSNITISQEVYDKASSILEQYQNVDKTNFGNAREARRLFNNCIEQQAVRALDDGVITKEELTEFILSDLVK